MKNYDFSDEFIKEFNSKLREHINNRIKRNGAIYMPFVHLGSLYDSEWNPDKYNNDPEYAAEYDKKSEQKGWESAEHTHFDVKIGDKEYGGKLWQVREFSTENAPEEYKSGDEEWTEIGLQNEFERDYFAQLWIDYENGYSGDDIGTYVEIELDEETKEQLNELYLSYRIFTGEEPEKVYGKDFIEEVRKIRETDWSDKKQVLEGVTENGWNLSYASEELRGDKEICMAALNSKWIGGAGFIKKYASPEIQEDPDIIRGCIIAEEKLLDRVKKGVESGEVPEEEILSVQEDIEYYKNKLEEIQKDGHTATEIAEGIEPTKTGMDEVTGEMVAEQDEKNNPNKDEKPGEEHGDN